MTRPLLLDTCAIIRTAEPATSPSPARDAMREARAQRLPIYVSPISAWELALLHDRGRLAIAEHPRHWFARLLQQPGVALSSLPPDVYFDAYALPFAMHGDPADRILVATARQDGLRLVTSDRRILGLAQQGHVLAVAC